MTRARSSLPAAVLAATVAVSVAFSGIPAASSAAAEPIVATSTSTATPADGASWSVAPADSARGTGRPFFDFALDAGASVSDAFDIRNDGAAPLTLRVYAADAFTTREGNIDLLPAGEQSVDAGTWVELGAAEVTLEPGETRSVPFTLSVPADARPGDHPAGIVTSLLSEDSGAQVQVDRRLGSRLFVRVGGELSPAVEVSEPTVAFTGSWNPLALGDLEIVYSLRNTGDTRVTAVAASSAHGPFGVAPVSTGAEQLAEVLPGSTVEVRQSLSGVAALLWLDGAVNVIPTSVGIGAAQLDSVVQPFRLPAVPVATLLILVAIAVIIAAVMLVLRRRRRA
ncbi:WxL protein peptidoglycan domain-containing protein [Labedella endophytica]|uniref:DUF916 domain-containing protein n=1 Tax=Labedella endophytica TaxID=1523160 RepID=A0A433JQY0_9MICO|nr:DUF916 domain-containing protein [Labedella endophytica]RUQ99062.1 DUF916 domain-containing protein [Labedella endophytica]